MKRRYPYRRTRRPLKRRRTVRRSYRKRGWSSRKGTSGTRVCRTIYNGQWVFSTATTDGFFRFNEFTASTHINNFAELANVYDEYKINRIKVTFRPRYEQGAELPTAAGAIAQPDAYAHYMVDQEYPSTAPSGTYTSATLNSFLENGKVKTRKLSKPFSVYFKPKIANSLTVGTSYQWPTWLPVANSTINHRGFLMFLQQNNFSNTNTNIALDIFVTVYAQFRGAK